MFPSRLGGMPITDAGATLMFNGGLLTATTYLGLHTGQPTVGNEFSGDAYARADLALADWSFANNVATLGAESFPTPTGTWGDPTHYGIWSAATGEMLIAWTALSNNPREITTGFTVAVADGAISITVPLL